jgi:hypothetical protein
MDEQQPDGFDSTVNADALLIEHCAAVA